jgi:ABC-type branched-subunit amino acid transport system substrate-binding protein
MDAGPDRRAIRDWIASIGGERPALEGVAGEIRFNEWGDAVNRPIVVTEVGR